MPRFCSTFGRSSPPSGVANRAALSPFIEFKALQKTYEACLCRKLALLPCRPAHPFSTFVDTILMISEYSHVPCSVRSNKLGYTGGEVDRQCAQDQLDGRQYQVRLAFCCHHIPLRILLPRHLRPCSNHFKFCFGHVSLSVHAKRAQRQQYHHHRQEMLAVPYCQPSLSFVTAPQ